jgi:hypothetical protein
MKIIRSQTNHAVAWDVNSMSIPAKRWIGRCLPSKVLHVFPQACNLINEEGEILSLVGEGVGKGPFAVVIATVDGPNWGDRGFQDRIDSTSEVSFEEKLVIISGHSIQIGSVEVWDPKIKFESLPKIGEILSGYLPQMMAMLNAPAFSKTCAGILRHIVPERVDRLTFNQENIEDRFLAAMIQPARSLCRGLVGGDLILSQESARKLAGLGKGLTPAGDDFIMGVLLGYQFVRTQNGASQFLAGVVKGLEGRTNALSMAFIRSACRGEASVAWHKLYEGLVIGSVGQMREACRRVLQTGHSSGADALTGFVAVIAWLALDEF